MSESCTCGRLGDARNWSPNICIEHGLGSEWWMAERHAENKRLRTLLSLADENIRLTAIVEKVREVCEGHTMNGEKHWWAEELLAILNEGTDDEQ